MGGRRQEAPSGAAAAAGTAQGHRAEPGGSGPAHAGSGAAHSRQAGTSGAGAGRSLLVSAALTSVPGRGAGLPGAGWARARALSSCVAPGVAMNIVVEFFVVTFKVLWAFVLAAARWLVRPKEKSVAGQVCLITGAGSGLGRLFALEFARRRALLVLWDINTQSNEETAGMVRHIYRDLEAADAAALQGNSDLRRALLNQAPPAPAPYPGGPRNPTVTVSPALEEENTPSHGLLRVDFCP